MSKVTLNLELENTANFTKELQARITESVARTMEDIGWAILQARIQERMHEGDAPAKVYILGNQTEKLYRRTGALQRAFVRGDKNSIQETKVTQSSISMTVGVKASGVPYASIHEYGGTITQTVTPKQRRMFWARYYREGLDEKWKAMALSKSLSIKIPARPYLTPALEEFLKDDLQRLVDIATERTQ